MEMKDANLLAKTKMSETLTPGLLPKVSQANSKFSSNLGKQKLIGSLKIWQPIFYGK